MAKRKVLLKWIENKRMREICYRKRKELMEKKLTELCTLCDVRSCIIMHNPDFKEPFIWPSNEEVKLLLSKFQSMSLYQQTKKMLSHEKYMKTRVEKLREEVSKQEIKNKKMEACILMHKILNRNGLNEITRYEDAELLKWYSEQKYEEVQRYRRCFPALSPQGEAAAEPGFKLHGEVIATNIIPSQTPTRPNVETLDAGDKLAEIPNDQTNGLRTNLFLIDTIDFASNTNNVASSSGKNSDILSTSGGKFC